MKTYGSAAFAGAMAVSLLLPPACAAASEGGRCPPAAYNPNSLVHVDPVIIPEGSKLDLNKADRPGLAGLAAFGRAPHADALVTRLIRHRPYASREDMEARSTLPCDVVRDIWPWVTVR